MKTKAVAIRGIASLAIAGGVFAGAAPAAVAAPYGGSCETWNNGYTGYVKCWNHGSEKFRAKVTCKAWNSSATATFYGSWYSGHYPESQAKTSSYTCSTDGSRYVVRVVAETLTQS